MTLSFEAQGRWASGAGQANAPAIEPRPNKKRRIQRSFARIARGAMVAAFIGAVALLALGPDPVVIDPARAAEPGSVERKPSALRGKNVGEDSSGISLSADGGDSSLTGASQDSLGSALSSKKKAARKKKEGVAKRSVRSALQKKAKRAHMAQAVAQEAAPEAKAAKRLAGESGSASGALAAKVEPRQTNEASWLALAQGKVDDGDYEGALAVYDARLNQDGNDSQAWNGKLMTLQQLATPEALAELERMAHARPFVPATHEALGQALAAQGDDPAALAALGRALELDPDNQTYLLNLAALNDRLGHDRKALELYRQMKTPLPYGAQQRLQALAKQAGE